MKIFKKIFDRMERMCDTAWLILRRSFILTAVMLGCSVVLFLRSTPLSPATYFIYGCAKEFFSLPAGILLIGTIVSVIIEDFHSQK